MSRIECVACYLPATKVVLGTGNLPACDAHGSIARFEGKTVLSLDDYEQARQGQDAIGDKSDG